MEALRTPVDHTVSGFRAYSFQKKGLFTKPLALRFDSISSIFGRKQKQYIFELRRGPPLSLPRTRRWCFTRNPSDPVPHTAGPSGTQRPPTGASVFAPCAPETSGALARAIASLAKAARHPKHGPVDGTMVGLDLKVVPWSMTSTDHVLVDAGMLSKATQIKRRPTIGTISSLYQYPAKN